MFSTSTLKKNLSALAFGSNGAWSAKLQGQEKNQSINQSMET